VAELGDAEVAPLERALAEQAAGGGGQVLRARPTDVATAVTFTRVAVPRAADDDAPRTT
jgi:hypothetical protein